MGAASPSLSWLVNGCKCRVQEAQGPRASLHCSLYPHPVDVVECQLPFGHIKATPWCSCGAVTPWPWALGMYVRGMSAGTGPGVAQTCGVMLRVRRGKRTFVHWQIALVRWSLKMKMVSTVLIITGLQAHCKFMTWPFPIPS